MYFVYVRPSSRRVKICSIPFFRNSHLIQSQFPLIKVRVIKGKGVRCVKIITPGEIFSLWRHDERDSSTWEMKLVDWFPIVTKVRWREKLQKRILTLSSRWFYEMMAKSEWGERWSDDVLAGGKEAWRWMKACLGFSRCVSGGKGRGKVSGDVVSDWNAIND